MKIRLRDGISFAFGGLLGDIGGWLLLGIVVAAVISFSIPADFFHKHVGGEFGSLFLMLALGIPLYTCATASTPVAAALVLKGLAPGAALVLLLAGPATNAATLAVVTKVMGKRAAVLYVAAVAACSILVGWVADRIYGFFGLDVSHWARQAGGDSGPNAFTALLSIVLLALIFKNYIPFSASGRRADCGCPKAAEAGPLPAPAVHP